MQFTKSTQYYVCKTHKQARHACAVNCSNEMHFVHHQQQQNSNPTVDCTIATSCRLVFKIKMYCTIFHPESQVIVTSRPMTFTWFPLLVNEFTLGVMPDKLATAIKCHRVLVISNAIALLHRPSYMSIMANNLYAARKINQ